MHLLEIVKLQYFLLLYATQLLINYSSLLFHYICGACSDFNLFSYTKKNYSLFYK